MCSSAPPPCCPWASSRSSCWTATRPRSRRRPWRTGTGGFQRNNLRLRSVFSLYIKAGPEILDPLSRHFRPKGVSVAVRYWVYVSTPTGNSSSLCYRGGGKEVKSLSRQRLKALQSECAFLLKAMGIECTQVRKKRHANERQIAI